MPRTKSYTKKKRILIVDDQAPITKLWCTMLEQTGRYVVREENHSRRTVATARNFRPDLLLLDIDMPHLDGTDVARLVRSDDEIHRTAILFLSSLVTPSEVFAGKRVEGHLCLPKPTCLISLVQTIEDTLAPAC